MVLPIEVDAPAEKLYNFVEAIPEGGGVLVSFDYGPATAPENSPMCEALIRHCFSRGLTVYATAVGPDGQSLGRDILDRVAKDCGKVDGEDYVMLGYKPNFGAVILGMGSDVNTVYSADSSGRPLGEIPAMRRFRNYDDISLIFCSSGSTMPELWMGYAGARYNVKCSAGITAVMVADFYPYLDTGQLVGMLCGMKGAAEYEHLIGTKGSATYGMTPQSAAHIMIVLFVIFGNVAMVMSSRRRAARRRR